REFTLAPHLWRGMRESDLQEGMSYSEGRLREYVMSDMAVVLGEVLVVEDDGQLLRLVQQVLEEEGYQVTPARGLDAALALLGEQRFALVVTDLFAEQGQEPLESIEGLVAAAAPKPVGVLTAWLVEE